MTLSFHLETTITMRRLSLLLLLIPSVLVAQRDTTVCTAFRTRTSTNGSILSTSVTKVACGGVAKVDTITLPGYTQYFYWHPVVVGSQVMYQIASMNNDPTPPPSVTLPATRVDTLRLPARVDTLAFVPSITPAFDSVRFTLQPYHASPIWTPASIYLKIDRYFYWWPVVGTDSIRFELRDGGAGASRPPSIAIPRISSTTPELPRGMAAMDSMVAASRAADANTASWPHIRQDSTGKWVCYLNCTPAAEARVRTMNTAPKTTPKKPVPKKPAKEPVG
jgi:hypothetical protein